MARRGRAGRPAPEGTGAGGRATRRARPRTLAGVELDAERPVPGGEVLAREPGGAVVLVTGAVAGERVRTTDPQHRRGARRAEVLEVIRPVPERVVPSCPHVAQGCGGCDWQHVAPAAQPAHKAAVVVDALARLGRIEAPAVRSGRPLDSEAYRTTVRAAVVDGRAGYRRRRSHEVVVPERCLVAHPLVDEVLVGGRFGAAREVTVRAGAGTGERLVMVAPGARSVSVPDDVVVVGTDDLGAGRRAWFHEEVAGHRFRISARSFFQGRPDGAEALVAAVVAAAGDVLRPGVHLVDAYAGVGLFSRVLLGPGGPAEGGTGVAVERSSSSCADARVNLAGTDVRVLRCDVDRFRAEPAELVVADPSRRGLGAAGVRALAGTGAEVLVLVSCDAGALGRDAGLLAAAGYRHDGSELVDLFPHTHHVEVVSRFVRDGTRG